MTDPTISAEERARSVEFCGRNIIAQVIRQAEQAAYERRDKDWKRWLGKTRIASAEKDFDIETAIMCGAKGEPTLHDAAQVGYAAAIFVWEAAITKRLAAISALAQEPEEVG